MKICWFDEGRLGLVEDDRVYDVSEALQELPAPRYPAAPGDLLVSQLGRIRPTLEKLAPRARSRHVDEVRFASPVAQPGKIIGVPVNYAKHVDEAAAQVADFGTRYSGGIREQGFFLKAPSSLVGPSAGVRIAFSDRRNDHELELAVVIGREARHVEVSDAMSFVAGYAIGLDMVVRGPEDRSMRKSCDTYSVLGPWMVTADELSDPAALDFRLTIGSEVRQESNTKFMLMKIAEQIAFASAFYTLHPGDVIMSGTCEGVGPVRPGDVMICEFEGIGAMRVPVHG